MVLEAPWQAFIGFMLDTPLNDDQLRLGWGSNIPDLADKASVGVDWTSANLNRPWFGGNSAIPDDAACNGAAWRVLITSGLKQVATGAC